MRQKTLIACDGAVPAAPENACSRGPAAAPQDVLVQGAPDQESAIVCPAHLKALTDHFGGGSRVVSFDPYS